MFREGSAMSRAPFVTLRITTLLNSSLFRALSGDPRAMLFGFGVLCFVAYGESSAAFAHTLLAALLVDLHGVTTAVVLTTTFARPQKRKSKIATPAVR